MRRAVAAGQGVMRLGAAVVWAGRAALRGVAPSAAVALLAVGMAACEPEPSVPMDCEGAGDVRLGTLFPQVQGEICASCHTGAAQFPDQSTEDAVAALVNAESLGYAPLKIVVPGSPASSVMYLKVAGGEGAGVKGPNGESVGGRMPPGQSLPDEKRELLRGWICSGALR